MANEKVKPEGLLADAEITLINDRYGILVDSTDVIQYKLCQVIIHLESKIEELGD